jgi:Ni,Fe-hydrogenase III small subunit
MPHNDDAPSPLLVDASGACAVLGGISRDQLNRIVSAGKLPVVRLPGRRDKRGHGTTEGSRRVLYAVDDLQRLVNESKERIEQPATALPIRKKGAA